MPASAASIRRTDQYRAQLLAVRQRSAAGVRAAWAAVTLDDLEASFRRWLAAAAPVVEAGKVQTVRLADAYLADYVSSELGRRTMPVGLDPADFNQAIDGRPVAATLAPALITVRMALQQKRPAGTALAMGITRALRTTSSEVVQTARVAQKVAMDVRPEITRWHRAVSGDACGACLGAATGQSYAVDVDIEVHTHCRCVCEPDVEGAPERVRRPTGTDIFNALSPEAQDRLFAGRGGEAKAELVRSGEVSLADLVQPSPMATVADQITETPLAALR